jgi:hypothetical protein
VLSSELWQGIELDKAPRMSPVQGSIQWDAVPSALPRTEARLLKLFESMTLLAGVTVRTFAKGTVRSISFCPIRTTAASPLWRPFGSVRQQLS